MRVLVCGRLPAEHHGHPLRSEPSCSGSLQTTTTGHEARAGRTSMFVSFSALSEASPTNCQLEHVTSFPMPMRLLPIDHRTSRRHADPPLLFIPVLRCGHHPVFQWPSRPATSGLLCPLDSSIAAQLNLPSWLVNCACSNATRIFQAWSYSAMRLKR